eukprot:3561565-Alexandrium_andersonii.AAC.1
MVTRSSAVHALNGLGIKGTVSTIDMWPDVGQEVWDRVTHGFLACRPNVPREWRTLLDDGCLSLPTVPLVLRRPPAWRKGLGESVALKESRPILVTCVCGASIPCPRAHKEGTSWSKVKCPQCSRVQRCGQLPCAVCKQPLRVCTCMSVETARSAQSDLRRWHISSHVQQEQMSQHVPPRCSGLFVA